MKINVEINSKIKNHIQKTIKEVNNVALSEEARKLRNEQMQKGSRSFLLKKAFEYGIDAHLSDEEKIKAARKIYNEEYWERKAQREKGE